MSFVSELEPKQLWKHFDEILKIPRGSKNEGKIREYVISIAKKNGLQYKVDATGNVVVRKPASPGHENAPITVLQSHLDMVNEKNSDVEHDFEKDPIIPRREDGYLKASGTTLGSDNGIGVAAMLAVMESKDLVHGPLELLFTIDEETGLTGASNLANDMLQGRQLLNLDTEEEGALYVGCAGGADSKLMLPTSRTHPQADSAVFDIQLAGLKGGHSGVDIHLQRGNAVKLLARALYAVSLQVPIQVVSFRGGNKHNAIPREAFAEVAVASSEKDKFKSLLQAELEAIREEFRPADPDMQWEVKEAAAGKEVLDQASSATLLQLLNALPHGVMSMSYDIPDLVETSTNLATANSENDPCIITMSSRSSVASALTALRQRIRATASLAGAEVEEGDGYPGWKPNMNSNLLKIMKKVHKEVIGHEPAVKAVHAGLETGIIGEKYPGMDMISFGPQIEFPHSPDERVKIDSVERFYKLLVATLKELA
ncbi:MAG: aminoacyl-histidine dipeptidase [Calditrichaeota bacterium]|nr:MAG: aminoacyl-histidine dipeptidase [Calditrichota bacterium]